MYLRSLFASQRDGRDGEGKDGDGLLIFSTLTILLHIMSLSNREVSDI